MYDFLIEFLNSVFSFSYGILTTDISELSPTAYSIVQTIVNVLRSAGGSICIISFLLGLMQISGNMIDTKNPTLIIQHFLRLLVTYAFVLYSFDLVLKPLYSIAQGLIKLIFQSAGAVSETGVFTGIVAAADASGSASLSDALNRILGPIGALLNIWGLIFTLACLVSGAIVMLTVAGRFLKIAVYMAVAPLPLSFLAGGHNLSAYGVNYLRNLGGVFLEGLAMALSLVLFSAFVGDNALVGRVAKMFLFLGDSAAVATVTFFMCGLTALLKGADTLAHKLMGFM